MNSKRTAWIILGALAITAIGINVIPPLLRKYSNRVYKASSSKEEIDFCELGPEIVKKDESIQEG